MMIYICIILTVFLIGFLAGKKVGYINGFRKGTAELPLILRQKSFAAGTCHLCNAKLDNKKYLEG